MMWNHNVKALFFKGLERVGQTASSLASNAHQKLDELNVETRRRELLQEIPVRAMELWQNNISLPEELNALLAELNDLDQQLTVMRAQRYAKVEEGNVGSAPEAAEADTIAADVTEPEPAIDEQEPEVQVTEDDETGGNA